MKSHEFPAPENGSKGQQRCAPEPLMQVHEKRYMKRAGVAGLRERASKFCLDGWEMSRITMMYTNNIPLSVPVSMLMH